MSQPANKAKGRVFRKGGRGASDSSDDERAPQATPARAKDEGAVGSATGEVEGSTRQPIGAVRGVAAGIAARGRPVAVSGRWGEEDDDGLPSQAPRGIIRMAVAPAPTIVAQPAGGAEPARGGAYSAEELAKLRSQQTFKLPVVRHTAGGAGGVSDADAVVVPGSDDEDADADGDDGMRGVDRRVAVAKAHRRGHKAASSLSASVLRSSVDDAPAEVEVEAVRSVLQRGGAIPAATQAPEHARHSHPSRGSGAGAVGVDAEWERQVLGRARGSAGAVIYQAPQLPLQPPADAASIPPPAEALANVLSLMQAAATGHARTAERALTSAARSAGEVEGAAAATHALRLHLTSTVAAFDRYADLHAYLTSFIACMRAKAPMALRLLDAASSQAQRLASGRSARRRAECARAHDGDADANGYSATWLAQSHAALAAGSALDTRGGLQTPSLDDDDVQRREAVTALTVAADLVFDDVADDYRSLASVLGRLAAWKGSSDVALSRAFADSFASLSVPAVLAPIVQVHSWRWLWRASGAPLTDTQARITHAPTDGGEAAGGANTVVPLSATAHASEPELEHLPWFTQLWQYSEAPFTAGTDGGASIAEARAAEDNIIPRVIHTHLLPHLATQLKGNFDAFSADSTHAAIAGINTLLMYEPSADAVALLLASVTGALTAAASDVTVCIDDRSESVSTGTICTDTTVVALCQACELLDSVDAWHALIAPAALAHIVFECIVAVSLAPVLTWVTSVFATNPPPSPRVLTALGLLGTLAAHVRCAEWTERLNTTRGEPRSASTLSAMHGFTTLRDACSVASVAVSAWGWSPAAMMHVEAVLRC